MLEQRGLRGYHLLSIFVFRAFPPGGSSFLAFLGRTGLSSGSGGPQQILATCHVVSWAPSHPLYSLLGPEVDIGIYICPLCVSLPVLGLSSACPAMKGSGACRYIKACDGELLFR